QQAELPPAPRLRRRMQPEGRTSPYVIPRRSLRRSPRTMRCPKGRGRACSIAGTFLSKKYRGSYVRQQAAAGVEKSRPWRSGVCDLSLEQVHTKALGRKTYGESHMKIASRVLGGILLSLVAT